ncbi:MAG: DUF58 domain-containing protein [Deltaproteobacteria bacterium]|nr:DUF58 domain-containing protein [Deltaproteobacteria bacterium]
MPLIRFMVASALFVALLNGQNSLALLAIIVLVVVSGARLWSRFSLKAVTCVSSLDKSRVFPGETLLLRVEAVNAKFLPVWLCVTIAGTGKELFFRQDESVTRETGLLWHEQVSLRWELMTQKRGVYPLGAISIKVSDLLGFFPREIGQQQKLDLIVYPRIHTLKDVTVPRRDLFGKAGDKSPLKDPAYFLGTREYQAWRPARYIHWKASASHNLLQEKLFEPSEQEKVLLVFEVKGFSESQAAEELEEAIEAAASLAVHLEKKGCAGGLVTDAQLKGGGLSVIPVARSSGQTAAILETLARIENRPERDLVEILERGLKMTWGTSCLYFTYGSDTGVSPVLVEFFRRRRVPVLCVISGRAPTASGDARNPLLKQLHVSEIVAKGGEAP